jgi:hypothetical protein
VDRSPGVVLAIVGMLGAVFAIAICLLVRREEKRGDAGVAPSAPKVKEPRAPRVRAERARPVKEPRVRAVKEPRVRASRAVSRSQPRPEREQQPVAESGEELPDPRRPSLVLNLEAFTEFRSHSER